MQPRARSWTGQAALHHHPPQDQLRTKSFIQHGTAPIILPLAVAYEADCYPTEVKYVTRLYAKRREDGSTFPSISKGGAEQRQSRRRTISAAPPPVFLHPSDTVYCLHWGVPHEIRIGGMAECPPAIFCRYAVSDRASYLEKSRRGSPTAIIAATPNTGSAVLAIENHARAS